MAAMSIASLAAGSASAGPAEPTEEFRVPPATLPAKARWGDMDAASDVSDGSHMPPLKVHVVTPNMAHSVAASEVSASAGPLNPREMNSASAGSSRPPKHDRHGNPVMPAPAAHSHPGSVVSASAGHSQGGKDTKSLPKPSVSFGHCLRGHVAFNVWTKEPFLQ